MQVEFNNKLYSFPANTSKEQALTYLSRKFAPKQQPAPIEEETIEQKIEKLSPGTYVIDGELIEIS